MNGQETEDLLKIDMKNMKTIQQLEYHQKKERELKEKLNYISIQNIKRLLDYQDYQKYSNERNEKAKQLRIELSSEQLKSDYKITQSYLYLNFAKLMITSLLFSIFLFVYFKFLGATQNLAWLFASNITSILLIIFLISFLYMGSLIDIYSHKVFYAISIIESINLIFSIFLNIINIYLTHKKLYCEGPRCSKNKSPSKVMIYILIFCNILIIFGFLLNLKFTYALFVEGFNIFTKKEKSIVQKQLDINERKKKIDDQQINCKKEEKKVDKKRL